VLLAAEESAGVRVLKALAASPHEVVAVLTTPDEPGRGAGVDRVARGLGLDVVPAEQVRDPALADRIRAWDVDLLLNVHSLFVAHADVVSAPLIGSFNLHPGPLPEYAGLNVPSWAIVNGETTHAVTVHWMEPGIDTGAIAYEAPLEIADDDTGLAVSLKCIREGIPLVERLLADAANGRGEIPALPQDLARRRLYLRGTPDDGRLGFDRPARRVVDLVRAADYDPFPSPWDRPRARLDGADLQILNAARTGEPCEGPAGTVGTVYDAGALVAASDEWVLVRRVAGPDGPAVPAGELLRPGLRFEVD
jgi:UDP-4-amino-4-deoxy-L-arabinose formyltransferase/UDP-glucuronic acid dehydrogenase (UDP-4-keto-hexauronic acid decarboxylating)